MFAPSSPPAEERTPEIAGGTLLLHAAGERWRVACGPGAEVAPCPPAAPVPGGPPWLLGMVVHKGDALPVVDLAVVAPADGGDEEVARARRRILVLRACGVPMALGVDDVDADDGGDDVRPLDVEALLSRLLQDAVQAP